MIGLVAVTLLLAVGANGASAQTTDTSGSGTSDLGSQFGGYKVDAHGEGLTMTYDSPGLIPGTPSPLVAGSLPESLSNMDSGPSGYALASLVYPGPLIADLPSVLALGGVPQASAIPSYPVRQQAFYPAGPLSGDEQVGSGRQTVSVTDSTSDATTDYGAVQAPPVLSVGDVTSVTHTDIEQGQVVSRVHVELSNVDVLAGAIHMDSVATDLVADSDSKDSASDGATVVSGLTFLGLPATLDAGGLHTQAAQSGETTTTAATGLGSLGNSLVPVDNVVSSLLTSVVGSANADANQLLQAGGIAIKLLAPVETKNGASDSRLASGLLITLTYNGQTEPVLSQILGAIPVNQLPSQGVGPIPFSSPQSLVEALKATHIITLGLGAGDVDANAAPPFALPSLGGGAGAIGSIGGTAGSTSAAAGGKFTTPAPPLGAGGTGGTPSTLAGALSIGLADSGPLAAAVALMILLLAGSGFWVGAGRLADNVLSESSASCPDGLDGKVTG